MSIDIAALLAPISESSPAGEEARSTDDYELVSSEIDKMTSLSGASPVDWGLVERHGAKVLGTQSKDFMLAAWVSAAWMERHGLAGLKSGLELHAGLIENYWEQAFPPLKRLRGRRNALSWWVDRASNWLENSNPPALDATTHATMVEAATRIDQGLAEHDPEAPPLGAFLRQLKHLDIIPEPTDTEDATAVTADNVEAPAAAAHASANSAAPDGAEGVFPAEPHPASTPPVPVPATPATVAAAPVAAPDFSRSAELATLDDIIDAMQPVAQHLGHIGSALLEIDRFQPLLVEINRFAARASLLSTPPAVSGTTALMPPPVAIADAFATVCGAGNAEGIIAFCESRILAFPFWLDLDRQAARGYAMLGEQGAPMRQAVIKNTLAFIERLPGVEALAFSDGTPFASEETRQWLEECRAQHSGAEPQDAFAAVQAQARAAANDGRHDDAMQLYQSVIQSTFCGRDQFRARIALIELLLAAHGDIDPMPLVQPLIHDCTALDLAAWEPALAAQAWQTILRACRQALANPAISEDAERRRHYQQLRQETLQHLARVDFPSATRFSQ